MVAMENIQWKYFFHVVDNEEWCALCRQIHRKFCIYIGAIEDTERDCDYLSVYVKGKHVPIHRYSYKTGKIPAWKKCSQCIKRSVTSSNDCTILRNNYSSARSFQLLPSLVLVVVPWSWRNVIDVELVLVGRWNWMSQCHHSWVFRWNVHGCSDLTNIFIDVVTPCTSKNAHRW